MNREDIISLRFKTVKRLQELLGNPMVIYVRSYHFYDLGNPNTDDYSGILLELRVNRRYHYYDSLLNEWKKQLNAAEYFVTFKCNTMTICFKIREF